MGIDLGTLGEQLEAEGVEKFVKPFDALMAALGRRRGPALADRTKGV